MGKTTTDPGNGYEAILHLTKEFLNKFLKNKNAGSANFFDNPKIVHSWIKECIVKTSIKIQGS